MCQWGTNVDLLVPMPAELSHTGEFRWAIKPIDACIVPLIQALNEAGIYTANCCCGHGKAPGLIVLHDGRALIVTESLEAAENILDGLRQPIMWGSSTTTRPTSIQSVWIIFHNYFEGSDVMGVFTSRAAAETAMTEWVFAHNIEEERFEPESREIYKPTQDEDGYLCYKERRDSIDIMECPLNKMLGLQT